MQVMEEDSKNSLVTMIGLQVVLLMKIITGIRVSLILIMTCWLLTSIHHMFARLLTVSWDKSVALWDMNSSETNMTVRT